MYFVRINPFVQFFLAFVFGLVAIRTVYEFRFPLSMFIMSFIFMYLCIRFAVTGLRVIGVQLRAMAGH
jgi:hypothetical protein